jgi:hypothetical protein
MAISSTLIALGMQFPSERARLQKALDQQRKEFQAQRTEAALAQKETKKNAIIEEIKNELGGRRVRQPWKEAGAILGNVNEQLKKRGFSQAVGQNGLYKILKENFQIKPKA